MRILLFVNNWVGWKVTEWLCAQGTEIVGLILHPPAQRKYAGEILRCFAGDPPPIFDGSQLRRPEVIEGIRRLRPDMGISAFFGYILKRECIDLFPRGCVNVHSAFLPYNRGADPNIWSIVEGTPAGATVHYIDEGIDTGDIIARKNVAVEPVDTGESLYRKLERACADLFRETWPRILAGTAPRTPQEREDGTAHCARDMTSRDAIDLDCPVTPREFINLLRARTFPPHPGVYFRHEGRKVFLRLQLLYEEQLREGLQPAQPRLSLREVREEDCTLLWRWSNDPETRAASFSSDPIPWEQHVRWFHTTASDPRCLLLIAIDERGRPVGEVRFEVEGRGATVSVTVDPSRRRRGYGSAMIALACAHLFRTTGVSTVHAYVKPENDASVRVFTRAGFAPAEPGEIRGQPSLHFERRKAMLTS